MKANLYISFSRKKIHSFHFFGGLGFVMGLTLGLVMAEITGLSPWIILLMSGVGAVTFFIMIYAAKGLTGKEVIVYYHHEISILLLCALTLSLLKLPVLVYLDITLLGIGVFLAFGRIGCYSVGCCHGRPHKHGVKYGQQHVDVGFTWFYKDVPLLPVQLIESAYVFLTVIAGVILLLNKVQPGTVLIVYTVVYGLMRYILEFFRGDPERPLFHGVSEAQWTSLLLTAVTFIMVLINWLPSYNWHLFILILQLAITTITIFYFKKYPVKRLFVPGHVKELAEGLNVLEELNNKNDKSNTMINLYTTHEGLCISCGIRLESKHLKHYTVSLKGEKRLNEFSIRKIAKVIAMLNHQNWSFNIIEKETGIYHVLFDEG
jgi:prolipoprotein diacylglyceryltransferase